jgi:hypothetical protein
MRVLGGLGVVALLYLFCFGARSPFEFSVLTALLVAGGAILGTSYARRQRMTRPALLLAALSGAGSAFLLTVCVWVLGLLLFSEG